jgi:hypothetical protein
MDYKRVKKLSLGSYGTPHRKIAKNSQDKDLAISHRYYKKKCQKTLKKVKPFEKATLQVLWFRFLHNNIRLTDLVEGMTNNKP